VVGAAGLVSPAWVAEHLDDPHLALVEVDEEAATHHWSHPPGATFIDWQDCRRALLAPRPASTEAFEQLMSQRGIRPDDDVVLFGDGANRYACAVLWLMRHHGHRSLRVMDGGRAAWAALSLPMTESETQRRPTAYRTGEPDLSVRATRDDVLRQLSEPASDEVLLDCRTPQEFAGQATGPTSEFGDLCSQRGHVPGAVNLPATDLIAADGAFLPADQLAQVLSDHGLRADRSITAYCHTSDRSCLVWFALRDVLGYPSVKVYDGGWLEYGHLLGVPVTGPEHADDPSARLDQPSSSTASDGAHPT
jgi:thiosulfate/3-mercaptopyruvate sulfurtransferase